MKGICFIEPLFIATIEGRKTQTRRIVKSSSGYFNVCSKNGVVTDIWECDANGWNGDNLKPVKSRYNVGDKVYLKEPYFLCDDFDGLHYDLYKYRRDTLPLLTSKWKNKLFMPASAARYFIQITGVRAEKLQEITEEDCFKEGILGYKESTISSRVNAIKEYAELIDKINGKGTWDSNPYVFVYDYELIEL